MSQTDNFQRRAIVAMVAVAMLSMSVAAVLALDAPTLPSAAPVPSTASRAATGHRALLSFVRALGFPVRRTSANARDVRLILEPQLEDGRPDTAQRLREHALGQGAGRVLVVLPKWKGVGDPGHPGWLASVQTLPAADVAVGLSALGLSGSIERHEGVMHLYNLIGEGEAEIERPQLMSAKGLQPLVSGPEGVLVGERVEDGQVLIVVSDPDLLSNHGLRRGDNAFIVAALLARLAENTKAAVVFDESLIPHRPRSVFTGLFHFPTVFAVFQLLLCLGLCVWAGLVRFGAPVPEVELGPRGAAALVESAVALQVLAGSPLIALRSLLEAAVRDVSQRLHAPATLSGPSLDVWFETRASAFGQALTLSGLRRQVIEATDGRKVLAAAQAVQRWRKRMVDGTR